MWCGHAVAGSTLGRSRSRLRFFAKAIGESDPVYTVVAAARDAGHADLPAPPTFLFAAEMDSGATDRLLQVVGIPITHLLHGEQGFRYHGPACAGDTITVRSRIEDIYQRKSGALEFVVRSSQASNQRGDLVAELRSVLVCRH
jgi:acyl dehydratase